jgi:tetratricopeptide (TPR) repeat protein
MLEARHHLLQAGQAEDAAARVTETICGQLHIWGAWDQEASLIHDTLARLPANSPYHAPWINQLGILSQLRGDYDEAARHYRRALDISERLGNQAAMASGYHSLGGIAQARGDYDEAARQYQRSLGISERLGDQADISSTLSQLGILEADKGGNAGLAISWHMKALAIRLRLGIPQARNDLYRLAAHRRELSPEQFKSLLSQATSDAELADVIPHCSTRWTRPAKVRDRMVPDLRNAPNRQVLVSQPASRYLTPSPTAGTA